MSEHLISAYDWLRGFHILAVIAWMAGMLYLPRLFVYHCNAEPGGELDRVLKLQERRLLKLIMNPAMIAAWVFGALLIWSNAERAGGWSIFLEWDWLVKLAAISVMTGLHHVFAIRNQHFANGTNNWSQRKYRIYNEIPAVLAIVIVLIATVALR
ncbi:CopD family protein [cf. Phormidesmis sp. LEGE 11477]|uniref:CopD family protein n=1 Tax=cf. Phormidesmis sp. LEGE 11477 TaxID=1828680 RepID=UPI001881579E|nr:CopD family protein [cf. Phormidesmis sp. LEGE 11477]MBE9065031.1 CopD family protein [cf. Phormidesmis sp. LEGE 11477]